MKSIDDDKIAIFKSRVGFIIPFYIAKQFLPVGKMSLEVGIQDLRTRNQNNETQPSTQEEYGGESLPSAPPNYEEAMNDDRMWLLKDVGILANPNSQ